MINLFDSIINTPAVSSEPGGLPLVDPGQAFAEDQGASKLLGQLNRAQWEDWKTRFQPYIQELATVATDEQAGQKAADQAQAAVGLNFDNAHKNLQMNQSDLGISLDATEQATQDRNFGLSRTAASVDAMNGARVAAEDRKQKVLGGDMGLSNIPGQVVDKM